MLSKNILPTVVDHKYSRIVICISNTNHYYLCVWEKQKWWDKEDIYANKEQHTCVWYTGETTA